MAYPIMIQAKIIISFSDLQFTKDQSLEGELLSLDALSLNSILYRHHIKLLRVHLLHTFTSQGIIWHIYQCPFKRQKVKQTEMREAVRYFIKLVWSAFHCLCVHTSPTAPIILDSIFIPKAVLILLIMRMESSSRWGSCPC